MRDPVVESDGHSYERASIEEVLRGSGLSPRTREPLTPQLFPNRDMRTRIEEHEAEQEAVAQRAQAVVLERLPASVVEELMGKRDAPELTAAGGTSAGAGASKRVRR